MLRFSGERTESADNHLDAFDGYVEIKQIDIVDANHDQGCIFIAGQSKKSVLPKVEMVDHIPVLQTSPSASALSSIAYMQLYVMMGWPQLCIISLTF